MDPRPIRDEAEVFDERVRVDLDVESKSAVEAVAGTETRRDPVSFSFEVCVRTAFVPSAAARVLAVDDVVLEGSRDVEADRLGSRSVARAGVAAVPAVTALPTLLSLPRFAMEPRELVLRLRGIPETAASCSFLVRPERGGSTAAAIPAVGSTRCAKSLEILPYELSRLSDRAVPAVGEARGVGFALVRFRRGIRVGVCDFGGGLLDPVDWDVWRATVEPATVDGDPAMVGRLALMLSCSRPARVRGGPA